MSASTPVLARSVFILLVRTSEINSPKNNYAPMHFLFWMLGGGYPAVWGHFCGKRECVHFVGANQRD